MFDYRGRVERARPGDVLVLHPDEAHDGRAGGDDGFGYRIVYVEPARIAAAVHAIRGRPASLPFAREPVSRNPMLARAITAAFQAPAEPLALDALVLRLAEGLVEGAADGGPVRAPRLDPGALDRARAFLDDRRVIVRSTELEAVTGLNRYELARQFRARYGTSPYRYSLAAPARVRAHPAAPGDAAGGPGAGGGFCRPGALHAHVPVGLRGDAGPVRAPARQRLVVRVNPELGDRFVLC